MQKLVKHGIVACKYSEVPQYFANKLERHKDYTNKLFLFDLVACIAWYFDKRRGIPPKSLRRRGAWVFLQKCIEQAALWKQTNAYPEHVSQDYMFSDLFELTSERCYSIAFHSKWEVLRPISKHKKKKRKRKS